ncbi:hypothetical protein BGW41_004291 [Actinomortierella wolfii]|nr:hypothetical protein BGW41_004291 [Actinomortierella wolfii]
MAVSIPHVGLRDLIPPSHSFESISSPRSTPTPSERGSPASSPGPQSATPTFGGAFSKGSAPSFLPKSTLKTPSSSSEQLVDRLLQFRASFQKRDFWAEVAILERLYYKNKSQHRQAAHFQKLHECRRLASRIRDLNLAGILDVFVRDFYSGKSLRIIHDLKWDSVPTRQSVAFVMLRIAGLILLLQKMQTVLYKTYGDFYQLMSKTQFMSFALIAIGLCSRCSVMARLWTQELVDCYRMLQGWIGDFPQGDRLQLKDVPDYEKELPKKIEDLLQEPTPEVPQIPDKETLQKAEWKEQVVNDTTDDVSMDLGEVIKRPAVASTVKKTKESSTTASLPHAPLEEDLVAREMPALTTPVVSEDMEREILSELGSIFSKPSSDISARTNKKTAATTTTTRIESSSVKVKKSVDTSVHGTFGNVDEKQMTPKKKKKKKLLDTHAQSESAKQDNSGSSAPASPYVQSGASSATSSPPTSSPVPSKPSVNNDTTLVQKVARETSNEDAVEKAKSKKPKTSSLFSNFDDIFGDKSSSSVNVAQCSSHGAENPAKRKQKTLQSTAKGDKDEIDDLFGSMASKPKKPKISISAEIDSIFGSSKKKKKKGLKPE